MNCLPTHHQGAALSAPFVCESSQTVTLRRQWRENYPSLTENTGQFCSRALPVMHGCGITWIWTCDLLVIGGILCHCATQQNIWSQYPTHDIWCRRLNKSQPKCVHSLTIWKKCSVLQGLGNPNPNQVPQVLRVQNICPDGKVFWHSVP